MRAAGDHRESPPDRAPPRRRASSYRIGHFGGPDDLDLPSVCAAFESLLVERDAELTHHLCELGVTPLTIAFPWLVTAFSGHIEVEQVLLLWDRIIGFGSLVPVALLAVSIFRFRRDELLRCTSGSEVLEVLEDVHDVLAIPLLQDALAV